MRGPLPILIAAVLGHLGIQIAIPDVQITRAAIEHQRSEHALGTVALDPRLLTPPGGGRGMWVGEREPAIAAALVQVPTVIGLRLEDARVCSGTPRRCRILGADAYLAFTKPMITGSTATIFMYLLANSGQERMPIWGTKAELTLALENGVWKVVATRIIAQT